jgi:hypothetical protein
VVWFATVPAMVGVSTGAMKTDPWPHPNGRFGEVSAHSIV